MEGIRDSNGISCHTTHCACVKYESTYFFKLHRKNLQVLVVGYKKDRLCSKRHFNTYGSLLEERAPGFTFGSAKYLLVFAAPADRLQDWIPRVRPEVMFAVPTVEMHANLIAVDVANRRH